MSKVKKIIEKVKNLPPEIELEDMIKLLKYFGWNYESYGKGSHIKFSKENCYPLVTSVHNGKVKKEFLKDVIERLNLEEFNEKEDG